MNQGATTAKGPLGEESEGGEGWRSVRPWTRLQWLLSSVYLPIPPTLSGKLQPNLSPRKLETFESLKGGNMTETPPRS